MFIKATIDSRGQIRRLVEENVGQAWFQAKAVFKPFDRELSFKDKKKGNIGLAWLHVAAQLRLQSKKKESQTYLVGSEDIGAAIKLAKIVFSLTNNTELVSIEKISFEQAKLFINRAEFRSLIVQGQTVYPGVWGKKVSIVSPKTG